MKLRSMEIEGFRSFKSRVTVIFEPTVTVVIGANDHGKTNLLLAIQSLNTGNFSVDDDLCWDMQSFPERFPLIKFTFELDEYEKKELLTAENASRKNFYFETTDGNSVRAEMRQIGSPPKPQRVYVVDGTNEVVESKDLKKVEALKEGATELKLSQIPPTFTIIFEGCSKTCRYDGLENFSVESYTPIVKNWLPRVELIEPWRQVSDSITWEEIVHETNEFMEGILFYAGLEPEECESLFEQNSYSQKKLEEASKTLNETLKSTWSQGRDLEFLLRHNSKNSSIELLIKDPSVIDRFVLASRRSSGFTHYFTLKTILYGREKKNDHHYRIILFDEPGIYLHPAGQTDLLRVIRKLGTNNQVAFVTHSLFMIDKNHPGSHRLLIKGENGTNVNGKPYSGGWGRALSTLGLTLTGSILFANHVLLTEGDSDPLYLYAVLGKLNELNFIDFDLNSIAIMSTGDGKSADVLIRMLTEAGTGPKIAHLIDGDDGGKDRINYLRKLCKAHAIDMLELSKNTTIEDNLIATSNLLSKAVARYALRIRYGEAVDSEFEASRTQSLMESVRRFQSDAKAQVEPLINLLVREGGKIADSKTDLSKVGIAREFALLLNEFSGTLKRADCKDAIKLAERIQKSLNVPKRSSFDEGL